MCRNKAVHVCDEVINESNFENGDLFIGVGKNGEDEVSRLSPFSTRRPFPREATFSFIL